MNPFTPPRNALKEGLNGGSDDDNDHPLDQNKSVYPEPRANAAQAKLRGFEFRSKDKLVQAIESVMQQISDLDNQEDKSENCITKKMKLGDGRAAVPAPLPCPPRHPPPSPPPPPPSPPSSPPPSTPPPPPEEDAS